MGSTQLPVGSFPQVILRGLGKTPTLAYYSAVSLTWCIPSISIPINRNRSVTCPPLWLPNKKRLSYSWLILHLCPGPPFSLFLLEVDLVLSLSLTCVFRSVLSLWSPPPVFPLFASEKQPPGLGTCTQGSRRTAFRSGSSLSPLCDCGKII